MANIKLVVIFIVAILVVVLCGCTKESTTTDSDEMSKFIGTWELEPFPGSDPNDKTTYIFYENGSLLSIFDDYDGEIHKGLADFYIEIDKLCMKTRPHEAITDGDFFCYDYEFSNSDTKVVLTTSNLPTVTLTKVE